MKFRILCSVPDVHVSVNQDNPDDVIISVHPTSSLTLEECNAGDIVKIGNREYLIVDRRVNGCPVLITTKPVTKMSFGNSNNFLHSDVKVFCEEVFGKEYRDAVMGHGFVITDLQADDGTYFKDSDGEEQFNYSSCASIPSTSFYRKYRKVLSAIDVSGAVTSTAVTTTEHSDAICVICRDGILSWSLPSNQQEVFCVVSPLPNTRVQLMSRYSDQSADKTDV